MSESIIAPNKIKRALSAGETVVGTMVVETRQASVMQILANAGFDFVIVDNEHGAFSNETIGILSQMGRAIGLTPFVRVPDTTYAYIAQTLDSGAQGVMLPRITNADQVREAVQIMKYPPMGMRGCAFARGHTGFKGGSLVDDMPRANEETTLIVQIETKPALDSLDEILSVPGVDIALVGPTDLSIALGIPGQLEHPDLVKALETVIERCQAHGVYPALHINNGQLGRLWIEKGMAMLSSGSEIGHMMSGAQQLVSTLRD
ncbi:MAG: aldolase/citrate lyase family protein [Chloroflexota bacterium]